MHVLSALRHFSKGTQNAAHNLTHFITIELLPHGNREKRFSRTISFVLCHCLVDGSLAEQTIYDFVVC